MISRQWMVPHQWMINYNKQTEWIEKRGILLWLAFYAGGLGGGLYLVSLFFNNLWGMLIGWFIVAVLKGGFHFAFLGKPSRFWRMIIHPQTSWLSRGLIFVVSFAGVALIQMGVSYFLPGTLLEFALKVLGGLLALAVATYTGFVLNNVKGVPFWNIPLLPLLFVLCGILGGFGLTIAIALFGNNIDINLVENISRWLLIINALLVVIYLIIASNTEAAGKKSVLDQLRGGTAPVFWGGVVILGIIVPVAIAFLSPFIGEASSAILIAAVVCEIIGGMTLRYCILKVGIYSPLISMSTAGKTHKNTMEAKGSTI